MIGEAAYLDKIIASVLTTIVLVTKFINQPSAHGFFSYSDTFARLVLYLSF